MLLAHDSIHLLLRFELELLDTFGAVQDLAFLEESWLLLLVSQADLFDFFLVDLTLLRVHHV